MVSFYTKIYSKKGVTLKRRAEKGMIEKKAQV
jgi:hypothetical protein